MPEDFVSSSALCLSFGFFVFVYWPIETITANLRGLTHPKPLKNTNQVTLRARLHETRSELKPV